MISTRILSSKRASRLPKPFLKPNLISLMPSPTFLEILLLMISRRYLVYYTGCLLCGILFIALQLAFLESTHSDKTIPIL